MYLGRHSIFNVRPILLGRQFFACEVVDACAENMHELFWPRTRALHVPHTQTETHRDIHTNIHTDTHRNTEGHTLTHKQTHTQTTQSRDWDVDTLWVTALN